MREIEKTHVIGNLRIGTNGTIIDDNADYKITLVGTNTNKSRD